MSATRPPRDGTPVTPVTPADDAPVAAQAAAGATGNGTVPEREFTVRAMTQRELVTRRFVRHRGALAGFAGVLVHRAAVVHLDRLRRPPGLVGARTTPTRRPWSTAAACRSTCCRRSRTATGSPSARTRSARTTSAATTSRSTMRGTQISLIIALLVGLISTVIGVLVGAVGGLLPRHGRERADALHRRHHHDPAAGHRRRARRATSGDSARSRWPSCIGLVYWTTLGPAGARRVPLAAGEGVRRGGAGDGRQQRRGSSSGTSCRTPSARSSSAPRSRSPRRSCWRPSLSYLGLGVQPPDTSLGLLIDDYQSSFATRPWLFWWPALFIVAIALSVNFIGDGLRDAFDPKQTRVRA